MSIYRRALPVALSSLLAACASAPSSLPGKPTPTVTPPQPVVGNVGSVMQNPARPVAQSNVWNDLRNSFAMADCDADPAIEKWARSYTKNPERFEAQMRDALPRLMYVQQVAAQHNVAGEFALLPWVESHYRPIVSNKGNPAGMWQIMPVTATALGMRVDRNYDGRLDVPAATDAIMSLLNRYHEDLGDWRLVAYAYNAGEYAVRRMLAQHGEPAAEPVIPKLPVRPVTREHLTKLLAIACVVREPQRFNVELPQLPADQQLVSVDVNRSMPLESAADHAGMPVDDLKKLNAGFRNGYFDKNAATYLVMPSKQAEQFRTALVDDAAAGQLYDLPPLASNASAPPESKAAGKNGKKSAKSNGKMLAKSASSNARTHTVKAGDTLWTIARRYSVDVNQLKQVNHLNGPTLRLGQVLMVDTQH